MDKNEMLRRARIGSFSENNGKIMQAINLVSTKCRFVRLSIVQHGAFELSENEFLHNLGFLVAEGYIELRDTAQHKKVDIADAQISDLEVRYTGKGTRLMEGFLQDEAVKT